MDFSADLRKFQFISLVLVCHSLIVEDVFIRTGMIQQQCMLVQQ